MKDKYYTPEMEEFHVGFECESTYCLIRDSGSKEEWVKYIFNEENISYLLDAYVQDAYSTEFRVKYLDKKDIESCGWKDDENGFFRKENFQLLTTDYSHFTIYRIYYKQGGHRDDRIIFDGILKNISELKIILKQIGI